MSGDKLEDSTSVAGELGAQYGSSVPESKDFYSDLSQSNDSFQVKHVSSAIDLKLRKKAADDDFENF
jgi:hypothetical protein